MKIIRLPLIALCALAACSAPETSLPENAQNTKIEATVLDDVYQSRFAAYAAGNLSGLNLYDLQVMSLTSYRAVPPRVMSLHYEEDAIYDPRLKTSRAESAIRGIREG